MWILLAPLMLLTAACGCTGEFERSLEVQVVDARTGAWAAEGAVGTVEIGDSRDSLRVIGYRGVPPNDTATTLGSDVARAGRYLVVITKPGYSPWARVGVVSEGTCGLRTAYLTARLLPDSRSSVR